MPKNNSLQIHKEIMNYIHALHGSQCAFLRIPMLCTVTACRFGTYIVYRIFCHKSFFCAEINKTDHHLYRCKL